MCTPWVPDRGLFRGVGPGGSIPELKVDGIRREDHCRLLPKAEGE
jgi:hypothetical protein